MQTRTAVRSLLAPTLASLAALTILVGLGLWQVERLRWKTRLIETIAERTTAPAQELPPEEAWRALQPGDYAYRHVALTGIFEHDMETHVFRPLSAEDVKGRFSGIGDLVLTPLRLASGAIVVVNRGFVPQDRIDPATRRQGQVGGPVTLTGLMREPESRNIFTPADDLRTGTWFTRDPEAIARFRHLDRVAPFTVDADASDLPGGLPQGGETVLSVPNNHLSYAFTWFGLAIGLCGVFAAFAWRRLRNAATQGAQLPDPGGSQKTI